MKAYPIMESEFVTLFVTTVVATLCFTGAGAIFGILICGYLTSPETNYTALYFGILLAVFGLWNFYQMFALWRGIKKETKFK